MLPEIYLYMFGLRSRNTARDYQELFAFPPNAQTERVRPLLYIRTRKQILSVGFQSINKLSSLEEATLEIQKESSSFHLQRIE